MWKVDRYMCIPIFLVRSFSHSTEHTTHNTRFSAQFNRKRQKEWEREKAGKWAKKKKNLFVDCLQFAGWCCFCFTIDPSINVDLWLLFLYSSFLSHIFICALTLTLYFPSSFLFLSSSIVVCMNHLVSCGCVFAVVTLIHIDTFHVCFIHVSVCVFVCVSILVCIGREKNQPHCRKYIFFFITHTTYSLGCGIFMLFYLSKYAL